jgi:cytochrome bd-type quinol oxidase subunit 2
MTISDVAPAPRRPRPSRLTIAAGVLSTLAVGASFLSSSPASATSASAAITAGSLAFVSTPASASFSATLTGADQTSTATQAFDVGDATGSGSGWNVTATSTTFTTGGGTPHTLSTSATSVTSTPTVACDGGATCITATNAISYPFVLPAGTTAPTAQKLYNAAANTGMGNQTITSSFRLSIPASTYAGSYTSTWTYSLVSAP